MVKRKRGRPRKRRTKFMVGDIVYVTKRAPLKVRRNQQQRKRVVVAIRRKKQKKCVYYLLGTNHMSTMPIYWYRSYMLRKKMIGHRLKTKRRYHWIKHWHRKPVVDLSDTLVGDIVSGATEAYPTSFQAPFE